MENLDSVSEGVSPNVSIIIPVYNDEEHLERCLDSILKQSSDQWEAWIVDDHSDDSSAVIAEKYCSLDCRFHLICNEKNSSAWTCRAKAIVACSGMYIMFADADDFLEHNAVECVLKNMAKKAVDIIHFGTNVINRRALGKRQIKKYSDYLQPPLKVLNGREVFDSFVRRSFEGHLWNKAFKAEVLKKVIADVGTELYLPKAQDKVLYWAVCLAKEDISYCGIKDKLYNYNYGYGVESDRALSLPQDCIPFFTQAWSEDKIGEITAMYAPCSDAFSITFERSRYNLIRHSVAAVMRLSEPQRCYGLELAAEYWNTPTDRAMIVCAIAEFTWEAKAEAARMLMSGRRQAVASSKVRVIGTYYECMRNGGIQRVIAGLTKIWHDLGYQIVLFADEDPSDDDYPLPDHVVRVKLERRHDRCSASDYYDRGMSFAKLMQEYKIDCMVYHSYFSPVLVYDQCVCRALGIPFVLYQHNSFSRYLRDGDERFSGIAYCSTLADCVVCLSETDRSWWECINVNTHLVLNPLTFDIDKIRPAPRSERNILFVGRLCANAKRPHHAVEIAAMVIKKLPDAKLYIVGSTEDARYTDALKKRISELGVEDKIVLCGFQSDVAHYYDQSSLFLMCSAFEGAPMTLCEALSYSLPVVMYQLPYLAAAKDNKGIISVPQEDMAAAADAICDLLQDRKTLLEVGDSGRRCLEQLYGDDIGAQWRSVFDSLTEPHMSSLDEHRYEMAIKLADDHLNAIRKNVQRKPSLANKVIRYFKQYGLRRTIKRVFERLVRINRKGNT